MSTLPAETPVAFGAAVPMVPSVRQLRQAYMESSQHRYQALRAAFETAHGRLVDEYYAACVPAVVVLYKRRSWYKIKMDYEGTAPVKLVALLGQIRLQEVEMSALLQPKAQHVFAQQIFVIIVRLFAAWDGATASGKEESRG